MSGGQPAVRIVGVGAGPAGVMILERIIANQARDFAGLALDIHLVDPHEPGGGRIWRRTQSPLLKLNTMLRDDAVFTDASCEIEGPVVPGPSLAEWIAEVLAGRIARPDWWDAALEAEIREASDESFPTRRLNSAYLSWAYGEIVRRAAPSVTVSWHEDRVVDIEEGEPSAHRVRLASGAVLDADIVVHAVGHNGSEPSGQSVELGDFAARHGLGYVAPAFTADVDFDWVPAGEDVIVRGMGLAAVDLVVLLTEGRGGRFVRGQGTDSADAGGGRLRYLPSGREPVLHLGSRRGIPYRSKITSTLLGEPVGAASLEYVGPAFHERLARTEGTIDFERDVWPLLSAEFLTGYYRELFTGHPEKVRGSWAEFSEALRVILSRSGGFRSEDLHSEDLRAESARAEALRELIETHVPEAVDRLDLDSFDRPLHFPPLPFPPVGTDTAAASDSPGISDDEAVQRRLREHIAEDLRLRTTQRHSATQGLFMATLLSFLSLAEVPRERWSARSLTSLLPRQWFSYFSYVASGPPGHRLEEFAALSEAGLLHFLGGDLVLETDERAGVFRAAGSAQVGGPDRDGDGGVGGPARDGSARGGGRVAHATASAAILIDAWLPEATAAASDNELLRRLVASGQARELAVADAEHSGSTGQLAVGEDGRLLGTRRQFGMGPFTSTPTSGAFTRPGMNSLPFRLNDRFARVVLAEAEKIAGERQDSADISDSADRKVAA
ncbi:MAG: FAD/NAD(P)-binding protein [Leucobacter sp.]